jgi:hypothetical protein
MAYETRSPKEIEKDIQTAKDGEYFKRSQNLVAGITYFALMGLFIDWAKSSGSAIAGDAGGGLAACIAMALGKMCSGYVHEGVKYFFFQPFVDNVVIPWLEIEKEQAKDERSFFRRFYKKLV